MMVRALVAQPTRREVQI